MRRTLIGVSVLAMTIALGACTKVEEGPGTTEPSKATQTGGISTDPNDSKGPAAAIPGAKEGGTAYIMRSKDITHADPARQYSVTAMAIGQLYYRTLTTFKELGGNKLLLIGDGAETPPTDVNKDCKTWTFKIRKGMKYEDGTDITAGDFAYGMTRSFHPDLVGGATYIQEWLANTPQYQDVFDPRKPENKDKLVPGITVVNDYELKLEFQKAHCDMPYAGTMPFTAPVPKAKDNGVDYDNNPVSSGPYKITKLTKGSEIVLERNTHWDAKTDPLRHAYPEKFVVKIGIPWATAGQRIIADTGEDANAVATTLDPSLVATIAGNPALQSRVISEQTPFVWYLWINNQKVTDVNVRKALNYAVDRDAIVKSVGGDKAGTPGTTILSPLTIGYQNYDAYPGGATGNPTEAKKLLAGKTPELVLAATDDEVAQQQAVALKTGLERAGFKITIVTTPQQSFLDKIGEKAVPWDIYISGWAADWSTAATTLPVLWDGRSIKEKNNQNYMYYNSPATNAEIDRILAIADPTESAKAWAALDKKIMTDDAPCVPLYYDRDYLIHGSKVGGLFDSDVLGTLAFTDLYIKS